MRLLLAFPLLFSAGLLADDQPDADLLTSSSGGDVVLTATRLKQAVAKTPASVTVLKADDIARFGARSIPEALTMVPGLMVSTGGRYTHVSYHGAFGAVSRHLLILVDGMIAYRPGEARIEWNMLPVTLEDVQKIEVIRGPAAASYGTNAFGAVINIITKNPKDTAGIGMRVANGSGETNYTAQAGDLLDDGAWRVTVSGYKTAGRDDVRDDQRGESVHASLLQQFGDDTSVQIRAGVSQVDHQVAYIDRSQISFPDAEESASYLMGKLGHDFSEDHRLDISLYGTQGKQRQSWESCFPAVMYMPQLRDLYLVNQTYALTLLAGRYPTGGGAEADQLRDAVLAQAGALGSNLMARMCGTGDQDFDESLTALEIQDTLVVTEGLRVVFGFGHQRIEAESQTYLDGSESAYTNRAFVNTEWQPTDELLINAGGLYERGNLNDSAFMPRAGLNYLINQNNSLRFVYSEAQRTPDIFEQRIDWSYSFYNFDQNVYGTEPLRHFASIRAAGGLKNERIVSHEIGWHYTAGKDLDLDVKVFDDALRDIIGERLSYQTFTPTNSGEADQKGFEAQARVKAFGAHWLAGYAYLDHDQSNIDSSAVRTHAGYLGAAFDLGEWHLSARYTGGSSYHDTPRDFMLNVLRDSDITKTSEDYLDLKAGRSWPLGGYELTLAALVRHRFSDAPVVMPTFTSDANTTAYLLLSID